MIKFCNIIYYNLYKFGLLLNKVFFNPINKFFFKNKESGEEIIQAVKKISESKKGGIDITISGIHFYGLVYFFLLGCSNCILLFLDKIDISINIGIPYEYLLIILALLSFVSAYFLVDYKDRYVSYFNEFDLFTKKDKIKWACISIITVIALWFFGFGSLIFRLTS